MICIFHQITVKIVMMQIDRGLLLTLKRMISYNVGYGVLIAPIKSSAALILDLAKAYRVLQIKP